MMIALWFGLAWAVWGLSWAIAARWSAASVRSPTGGTTQAMRVMIFGGAALLFAGPYLWPRSTSLWTLDHSMVAILAVLLLAGFAFAWWARLHLGRMWSSGITRKEDHRIVNTGPYGLVRHPIYTGLILAIIAAAVAGSTAIAVAGGVIMIAGLWYKAALEEQFLGNELGPPYETYRRRVPMLIPFLPAG
jgi:protein-S-isoprenylcysteine O-methyltransferase Ste14